MCGFVGYAVRPTERVATASGQAVDHEQLIEEMGLAIEHRGPDQHAHFVDEGIALGFRRLSIIDLEGGSQPILNEDETKVLVFNGEIYNYQGLREELIAAGHTFRTHTDSEVVLHGYEQWGQAVLDRLRGMFAFVIWDRPTQTLFAARDIFGIKPFYYSTGGGQLIFGSEIKGFLPHPGFHKAVNESRLPDYLCFEYVPDRETMFEGVHKLLAGECLTWSATAGADDGQTAAPPVIRRYFDFDYRIDEGTSLDQWVDLIAETFTASVRAHKIADVEVGCFLSSGVDSSYATNELAKIQSVRSFSVGYAEERYSELPFAQATSERIGVENVSTKISAEDFFDAVGQIQYHMDEPLPNPSAIPLYYLARSAAKHVKVVLSGEGADELFGGYNSYSEAVAYGPYQRHVPAPLRRGLAKAAAKLPSVPGKRFLMRAATPIEQRFFRHEYNFTAAERAAYLAPRLRGMAMRAPAELTRPHFAKVAGHDDVTKMQYADFHTWLLHDILLKADKMSMASSLELRVPFLDREVLKVALAIPARYRVRKGSTKAALRLAALRELPPETAHKPKLGFPVPLADWLRDERWYAQVKAAFTSPTAAHFFDVDEIVALLDEHRAGGSQMKRIWTIYCFLLWHEEFFERR